jgi:hypothetical protein
MAENEKSFCQKKWTNELKCAIIKIIRLPGQIHSVGFVGFIAEKGR